MSGISGRHMSSADEDDIEMIRRRHSSGDAPLHINLPESADLTTNRHAASPEHDGLLDASLDMTSRVAQAGVRRDPTSPRKAARWRGCRAIAVAALLAVVAAFRRPSASITLRQEWCSAQPAGWSLYAARRRCFNNCPHGICEIEQPDVFVATDQHECQQHAVARGDLFYSYDVSRRCYSSGERACDGYKSLHQGHRDWCTYRSPGLRPPPAPACARRPPLPAPAARPCTCVCITPCRPRCTWTGYAHAHITRIATAALRERQLPTSEFTDLDKSTPALKGLAPWLARPGTTGGGYVRPASSASDPIKSFAQNHDGQARNDLADGIPWVWRHPANHSIAAVICLSEKVCVPSGQVAGMPFVS